MTVLSGFQRFSARVMRAGGRVLPVERMRAVVDVAREHGLPVHLDGARLPNAARAR